MLRFGSNGQLMRIQGYLCCLRTSFPLLRSSLLFRPSFNFLLPDYKYQIKLSNIINLSNPPPAKVKEICEYMPIFDNPAYGDYNKMNIFNSKIT